MKTKNEKIITFIISFISKREQKSNLQQYLFNEENNDNNNKENSNIITTSTQAKLINNTTNYDKNYRSSSQSPLKTKLKTHQPYLPISKVLQICFEQKQTSKKQLNKRII